VYEYSIMLLTTRPLSTLTALAIAVAVSLKIYRDFVMEGGGGSNLEPQNNLYDVGGAGSELQSALKNDPYRW
jgi:hypothetical protein